MGMDKFFNMLASGARSLSFAPTMEMPEFEHEDYKRKYYEPKIALREPKTPTQILKEAWGEVGLHMWNAMGESDFISRFGSASGNDGTV